MPAGLPEVAALYGMKLTVAVFGYEHGSSSPDSRRWGPIRSMRAIAGPPAMCPSHRGSGNGALAPLPLRSLLRRTSSRGATCRRPGQLGDMNDAADVYAAILSCACANASAISTSPSMATCPIPREVFARARHNRAPARVPRDPHGPSDYHSEQSETDGE